MAKKGWNINWIEYLAVRKAKIIKDSNGKGMFKPRVSGKTTKENVINELLEKYGSVEEINKNIKETKVDEEMKMRNRWP